MRGGPQPRPPGSLGPGAAGAAPPLARRAAGCGPGGAARGRAAAPLGPGGLKGDSGPLRSNTWQSRAIRPQISGIPWQYRISWAHKHRAPEATGEQPEPRARSSCLGKSREPVRAACPPSSPPRLFSCGRVLCRRRPVSVNVGVFGKKPRADRRHLVQMLICLSWEG